MPRLGGRSPLAGFPKSDDDKSRVLAAKNVKNWQKWLRIAKVGLEGIEILPLKTSRIREWECYLALA
jgi:hypothetical protein